MVNGQEMRATLRREFDAIKDVIEGEASQQNMQAINL